MHESRGDLPAPEARRPRRVADDATIDLSGDAATNRWRMGDPHGALAIALAETGAAMHALASASLARTPQTSFSRRSFE